MSAADFGRRNFLRKGLMKKLTLVLLALAVITGCTSEPSQPVPKAEPPEALTGRSAFQKLYIAARGWTADVRPYQLQSQLFGDNKEKVKTGDRVKVRFEETHDPKIKLPCFELA